MNDAAPESVRVARWTVRDWLRVVALLAMVLLAYAQVWRAGFVWDDDAHVTANPHIIGPLGLKEIWTSAAANYFPLVLSHFWALHALFGLNPLPYHVVNVLLHAAAAILLWRVLLRLGVRGAWLGAALWALHPVQVESVAWISELKNTQSAVFFLFAIHTFLRWLERPAPRNATGAYAATLLCAVLAILSKSSTVMLPVVLALCWWWREREWRWRDAAWLTPFFALSLTAGLWTIWEQRVHQGAEGGDWALSLAGRFALAGKVVWFYLGKLFWPEPLIFIYPRWEIDAARLAVFLPLFVAAGAGFLLWKFRDGGARAWFFAGAYFVVSLFPVMGFFNVYFFRYSFVGDHLQYLASMGVCAAAGAGAIWILERFAAESRRVVLAGAIGAVLVGTLGILSWRQSAMYRDPEALYRTTLARNPACWLAHGNLGALLVASGRRAEGLDHYREALQVHPGDYAANFNLGTLALAENRLKDAIACFEIVARTAPRNADAHTSLGVALMMARQLPEALPHLEKAAQLKPAQALPQHNLGLVLLQLGRSAEAMARFESAVRLQPSLAEAQFNLGNLRIQAGRVDAAIGLFEAALRLKPDHLEAHHNLGNALLLGGRPAAAIPHYEEVLRRQPENAVVHANLANALAQTERLPEAIAHLKTAVQLDSTRNDMRENLHKLEASQPVNRPRN